MEIYTQVNLPYFGGCEYHAAYIIMRNSVISLCIWTG